jgi:hypothetical protein
MSNSVERLMMDFFSILSHFSRSIASVVIIAVPKYQKINAVICDFSAVYFFKSFLKFQIWKSF